MQLKTKIKVVIAEDEEIIRRSIVNRIEACDSEFMIVAEAGNGQEAMNAIAKYNPELLITDIKMPVMDGIELIQKVQRRYPQVNLVILSGYSDFSYLQQAIRCGVSHYLLKPLEDDALQDTLQELKNKVIREQYHRNHTVIRSSNYHESVPPDIRQCMFSVCIGNLCYDSTDSYLEKFYHELPHVHWEKILNDLIPDTIDWSVSNEDLNEKIICIRGTQFPEDGLEVYIPVLQNRLQKFYPKLPIQVVGSRYSQSSDYTWMCGLRLQNLLHQQCIAGRSSALLLERDEKAPTSEGFSIVKMQINDSLRPCMEAKDLDGIRAELNLLFNYMVKHNVSQRDMEKVISYIIRIYEFGRDGQEGTYFQKIMRQLSTCFDGKTLAETLVDTIMSSLWPTECPPDLAVQLVTYVDQHFLHLDQLEDLSQVFNYNYTYLSRLFKKQTGFTLKKYILNRRLKLAMQLIENNEDMSVSQIAALSGFTDRRNFLRSFKDYTGTSPSEYKSSIILKD